MPLKQKITSIFKQIIKLPLWITIPVAVVLFVSSIFIVLFLQEKPVFFSYSNKSCVDQLTIVPSLSELTVSNSGFTVSNDDIVKLGNIQLFSRKTCFSTDKVPVVGDIRLSVAPFGGWVARKTFKLSIPKPPELTENVLAQSISTVKPLEIKLNGNDLFFNYQIEIDGKNSACFVKSSTIFCDVLSLGLLQGKDYEIQLIRKFGDQKIATLLSQSIKTISATNVIGSSITQDQIVFNSPRTFTFDFDKDVIKSNILLEKVYGESRTPVVTTATFKDKQLTVAIDVDLARDSNYELTIDKLESKDGSTLVGPYKLNFVMSDGPIVIGVNVGTVGLPVTQTIVMTFDQVLSDAQDITKFVSTSGIPTTISKLNNQVFVSYANASICTDLNISVSAGLQSNIGITQLDSWSYAIRTVCHSTSVIGYSKEGRSIVAYTFGSGGTAVLYIGAIHGNELSSKYLMDAWVNELEINARNIPANRKIVVIPFLNPDGVVVNRRNNSNNVDLNRNFPTDDWQTDIVTPANQPLLGGGGVSPLSEPESQAIATFTTQLSPRLTLSFHSSASYAIANGGGDSAALANVYSQLSGYTNASGDGGAFSYAITGTYDTWLYEKYNLTSLIIELSSSTNSEFIRNKAALWAMARS